MVIEVTPKQKFEFSPVVIIGVVICLVLAGLLVAAYFYFDLNIKERDKEIQKKQEEIAPLEQKIKEKEEELNPIKEKIDDFGTLISKHQTPLDVFSFLERNCLPNVWFSEFNFDSEKKGIDLLGHTDDFTSLEQQVAIFKQDPLLKSLSLSDVAINNEEGGVDFKINLIFASKIFKPSLNDN